MKDTTVVSELRLHEVQSPLGRELTEREIEALGRHVAQHGLPEIEVDEPWFNGDGGRPVSLTWMIDGQPRSLSFAPSAPAAKPRDLVRDHFERQARGNGGVLVMTQRRIGLDGRRTFERDVHRFPPRGCRSGAPPGPGHGLSRTRARGAGRPKAQATRSSARSGDSGSDSEGSEPPGRLCACGCNSDISHRAPQARYLNTTHADADRQRRKRQRGRVGNPDVSGRDPYLRLDTETFERLRRRVETGCRCNGHHIADPEDGHCCKCGHRRGSAAPFVGFIAAQSAETRRQRKAVV
jgi:hypothetical protein